VSKALKIHQFLHFAFFPKLNSFSSKNLVRLKLYSLLSARTQSDFSHKHEEVCCPKMTGKALKKGQKGVGNDGRRSKLSLRDQSGLKHRFKQVLRFHEGEAQVQF